MNSVPQNIRFKLGVKTNNIDLTDKTNIFVTLCQGDDVYISKEATVLDSHRMLIGITELEASGLNFNRDAEVQVTYDDVHGDTHDTSIKRVKVRRVLRRVHNG